MLSDSNAINDFNPFVVGDFNLPGTWSADWPYTHTPSVLDKEAMFDKDESSPLCSWGSTAGDGTVDVCNPPYEFAPKVSCPMTRPLEPEQLWDDDLLVVGRKARYIQGVTPFGLLILIATILAFAIYLRRR